MMYRPWLGCNIQEATQHASSEYKHNTNVLPNSLPFALISINFGLVTSLGMPL